MQCWKRILQQSLEVLEQGEQPKKSSLIGRIGMWRGVASQREQPNRSLGESLAPWDVRASQSTLGGWRRPGPQAFEALGSGAVRSIMEQVPRNKRQCSGCSVLKWIEGQGQETASLAKRKHP